MQDMAAPLGSGAAYSRCPKASSSDTLPLVNIATACLADRILRGNFGMEGRHDFCQARQWSVPFRPRDAGLCQHRINALRIDPQFRHGLHRPRSLELTIPR